MASRRATTTLTKLALALASLNASTKNFISHQCRAIAVATSAPTFGRCIAPFSCPGIVSDRGKVASAKHLASAFTRSFHSTTPNFYSATSFSQKDGLARRIFTKAGLDNITVLQATDKFIDNQPKDKYGSDLTELARRGKLDPVIDRDDEIRRCIQILSRRTKNNHVIIGELGVRKTTIAEGLAQRIFDSLDCSRRRLRDPDVDGRERRRISIRTDVIHNPTILFLDEPTSCLNSTSAFMVVKVLQGRAEHCVRKQCSV
ncbi:hypothetical protein TB2_021415 [Malus domestica]